MTNAYLQLHITILNSHRGQCAWLHLVWHRGQRVCPPVTCQLGMHQCFHPQSEEICAIMGWVTVPVDKQAYREAREKEKQALLDQAAVSLAKYYSPGYPGRLADGIGMCPMCLSIGTVGHLCYSLGCDSFDVSFQTVSVTTPTMRNSST